MVCHNILLLIIPWNSAQKG